MNIKVGCDCRAVGQGVQTFRIRRPARWFKVVADAGSDTEHFLESRTVWQCKGCGTFFACLRIPYKDVEEILVKASTDDWSSWDWVALAKVADRCRWRGPDRDERYVL